MISGRTGWSTRSRTYKTLWHGRFTVAHMPTQQSESATPPGCEGAGLAGGGRRSPAGPPGPPAPPGPRRNWPRTGGRGIRSRLRRGGCQLRTDGLAGMRTQRAGLHRRVAVCARGRDRQRWQPAGRNCRGDPARQPEHALRPATRRSPAAAWSVQAAGCGRRHRRDHCHRRSRSPTRLRQRRRSPQRSGACTDLEPGHPRRGARRRADRFTADFRA